MRGWLLKRSPLFLFFRFSDIYTKTIMNWLKFFVGLSALLVAASAAYFSVTGLGVLFSGATVSVMIMAGSLEFAKLIAASYIKQKWDKINLFFRGYLLTAVISLMLITSAGIFGYLSNAYQQQNLKLTEIERNISVFENKIESNNKEIARYSDQLKNLQDIRNSQEKNIQEIVEKGYNSSRVTEMVKLSEQQIVDVSKRIDDLNEENNKNYAEIAKIRNDNSEVEREIGGFRFVAEAFDLELNTVVKFFIFLIVFVFDPLAIVLVIAFNQIVMEKTIVPKKEEETYEVYGEEKKPEPITTSTTTTTTTAMPDVIEESPEVEKEPIKKKWQLIPKLKKLLRRNKKNQKDK